MGASSVEPRADGGLVPASWSSTATSPAIGTPAWWGRSASSRRRYPGRAPSYALPGGPGRTARWPAPPHGPVDIIPARRGLVMGEHQFGKLRGGDAVVCPVTSPPRSVVFPSIGALVTDMGGILSRPAIIAREHGTPAVVGTGNASSLLRDDQTVTVDGTTGAVESG